MEFIRVNEHEFEQIPGDNEGQGSLGCCNPWGHRVGHNLATEQWSTNPDFILYFFSTIPCNL